MRIQHISVPVNPHQSILLLFEPCKQLLQKERQLEALTESGMKEMDYREEIASLEHACSKLVVSLMNIIQQLEKSVAEIFEL